MKKQAAPHNFVVEAYEKVGGIYQAVAIMRVSPETARKYGRQGKILLAEAAMRLSQASGIPIEKFIGGG